jgi:predicted enzyme related to lactoylglutathione lyase
MSSGDLRGLIGNTTEPETQPGGRPMAITMSLASAVDATPAQMGAVTPGLPSVPTTRSVRSLHAALRDIRRHGGTVTSETRTVPGIGSWAFIADADGVEIVLWEYELAIG